MIRINLLPVREVERASSRRKELLMAGGFMCITLAVVVLVHFFQAAQLNSAGAQLSALESAMVKINKQNQDLEKIKQQTKDLEDKVKVVRLLTSPERRASAVHILDDLSVSTPERLWLIGFTATKGAAKINGKAVDNQTIATFAHNLSSSPYFQKVEIRETAQEAQAPAPGTRAGAGRTQPLDAPASVLMTRFLIEASLSNLPGAVKEGAPAERGEEKVQEEGRVSKPVSSSGGEGR